MIERNSQQVKGAAVVIEMEDGTRMLYHFQPNRAITLEMEHIYENTYWDQNFSRTSAPLHLESMMTVSGTFKEGVIWNGPMPGQEELGPQALER